MSTLAKYDLYSLFKWFFKSSDENPRKHKASDTDSYSDGYVVPKKRCCQNISDNKSNLFSEREKSLVNNDIEVLSKYKYPASSFLQLNGSHKSGDLNYSVETVRPKFPKMKENHNKLNMECCSGRNYKVPVPSREHKCSTLRKTNKLTNKGQYEILLENYHPPQRIDIINDKLEEHTLNEIGSVNKQDNVEALNTSNKSTDSKISKRLQDYIPLFKTKPIIGLSSVRPNSEVSLPLQLTKKQEFKMVEHFKTPKVETILTSKDSLTERNVSKQSITSNSLRESLASKLITKDSFIGQISRKYDERFQKRSKEAEELQKYAILLSNSNRQAREAAIEEQLARSMRLCDIVLDEREDLEETLLPTLTNHMINEIKAALVPCPPDQVLVENFRLRVTRKDMNTLAGLNWLNDEVINFYMNLLIERGGKDKYPRVHAMNTFFYTKLITGGHSSLKRWTKKNDIFAQDLVVVPVHLGMHWCMSVIDFRNKTIRYFDSMGSPNAKCLLALKQYLQDESLDKKKKPYDTSDWTLENAKDIPRQMNASDCGVFSCMFAEYICANKKLTFTQDNMPYFRKKMVYEILKSKLL
ncbi:sentrin-specific protease 1-like [Prorops nasuta]|uniref:sentrin-specific protease 1-like n=1 Tax=Prorops nasuta TaxID=863751 RepID=UPI0034CFBC9B